MAQPSLRTTTTRSTVARGSLAVRPINRRGLAAVEFVLWLPILLFVMALMVNYGTLCTWRMRGEIVSRDAAWRSRFPQRGQGEGRPDNRVWPAPATIALHGAAPYVDLDVPELDHPVVRGPLPNFIVQPVLDPDERGAVRGGAAIERRYPLLPRLGRFESGDIRHQLLRDKWQHLEMGIYNDYRRTLHIYAMPEADDSFPQAYLDAAVAILTMPNGAALDVLDRDEDFRRYYRGAPDFHPRVNRWACSTDREGVHEAELLRWSRSRGLIDRRRDLGMGRSRIELGAISYLPRTMTNAFLNLYRSVEQQLVAEQQALQNELNPPPPQEPPTPERIAEINARLVEIQAELDRIRPFIAQLEAYERRLPAIEDALRAAAAAVIP